MQPNHRWSVHFCVFLEHVFKICLMDKLETRISRTRVQNMSRRGPPRLYQKHLPKPPPQDFRFRDVLLTKTYHFFVFKITSPKTDEFRATSRLGFLCTSPPFKENMPAFLVIFEMRRLPPAKKLCFACSTFRYWCISRTRVWTTLAQQTGNAYFSNTCSK